MSTADRKNPRRGCAATVLNIFTVVVLLGVLVVVLVFISWFNNPAGVPQLLRPIEVPEVPVLPTVTATSPPGSPTPTRPPTETPLPTNTLRPSSTPLPTDTPFSLVTPPTAVPGSTQQPQFAYTVTGGPSAITNIYHPDLGCGWMGVGGQAIDQSGAHVVGLIVRLGGRLNGFEVDEVTVTGTAAAIGYGQSGWEFSLADGPMASRGSLYVQLFDQAENPLSDQIFFDTYEECTRNLIVINFVQTR